MDPVSVLAPLAKAMISQVGKEVGGAAARSVKARVLGDPEQKALQDALGRAFTMVQKEHGRRLADFDLNLGFWEHEGAAELSKVLIPGVEASAVSLAECAVDSLGPIRSADERLDRIIVLRPVFTALLTALASEVRRESALQGMLGRSDAAQTAQAVTAMSGSLGLNAASEDDRFRYLSWVIDHYRYLRTAGVVRNTTVQLPLDDVFVGLRAQPDSHPGDRTRLWFDQERKKLAELVEKGRLDQADFEVELDRLQTQYGRKFPADDDPAMQGTMLVSDAVRDGAQVLVLGDPGTGKTTLLRYLALSHARASLAGTAVNGRPARLPVYLRIGEYARQGYPRAGIGEFLPDHLSRSECRLPGLADFLARQLEAGRCLVLLDGLDEIASAELRRGVVAAVVNFVTAYARQGNRFVVTSRIAGYQAAPLPEPFQALRMRDMDEETITRFLQVYCRQVEKAETPGKTDAAVQAAGARDAASIGQAIRTNAGVRRLAVNPLLLTALVLVHRASGRLPHRRIEAYVEVCNALGRTWRSAQGVTETDLPDERILTRWLTELGAWMHQHRPEGAATKRELLQVLGPLWAVHQGYAWDPGVLAAADPLTTDAGCGVLEFVDKADTHTGLLVERAPGRYGFAHLTFEEFYAGRALAFRGTATDRVIALRTRLHDPRYEEPILLALGLIGTDYADQIDDVVAEAIYPATKPSEYEELMGRDFLFMLRVLADDTPLQTTTIDTIINQAIDEWLSPDSSRCRYTSYRQALSQRLAALDGTKAGERFRTVLDRQASNVTPDTALPWAQLAKTAAQLGSRTTTQSTIQSEQLPATSLTTLVQLATSDIDPYVRVAAVSALASGGGLTDPVIAALTRLTSTIDIDPSVRAQAGSALASGGALTDPVIAALTRLASTTDIDPSVRVEAGSALASGGALTDPVIAALTQLATTTTDIG
ncbi:NACHT domain-containing protein, partial [Paractinoplanes globisporus]